MPYVSIQEQLPGAKTPAHCHPFTAPGADHFGEVQAWNVDTGQRAWTYKYAKSPSCGSMLTTARGLVFSGGTIDRKLHAFDASNAKLLWEFPNISGNLAPPTSFAMDGEAIRRGRVRMGQSGVSVCSPVS